VDHLDRLFGDVAQAHRHRDRSPVAHGEDGGPAVLAADGVVGEIIFPNTVPPFYETAFHVAPPPRPEQYERWRAGTRAHNRWLAEFCAAEPARRAGIGLIHLNDVEDAVRDVEWIARHGLRGGVLLPLPSPSDQHLRPLTSPDYDRLWAAIQDCDLVVNQHSGQGTPHYGSDPGADALWVLEMPFFVQRGFCQLILGGVFERFPRLRYILTESGCAWAPGLLRRMDGIHMGMKAGMMGEVDYSKSKILENPPSFYARRNCWYGASFPSPQDVAGREFVGTEHVLWGNDYPHYEGCYPYSRENMRLAFSDLDTSEVRMMLGENAAKLYGFDLELLRPQAEALGITGDRVRVIQPPVGGNFGRGLDLYPIDIIAALLARRAGRPVNGLADAQIGRAATQVAVHRGVDLGIGRMRRPGE